MREGLASMHLFKNTIVAASKLRVQVANFRRNFRFDFFQHVVNPLADRLRPFGVTDFVKDRLGRGEKKTGSPPRPRSRPSVFVSYATDESLKGSHRYCGGEKLLNNLVLLLRRHGYDAHMVSMDGAHSGWLVEHAPFLSLSEFARRAREAPSIRCVTSWVLAEAFLRQSPGFYFWDQELATTTRSQFPVLARWMREKRILGTAGLNRSIQAWHMAIFERRTSLLRTLVDEKHWKPDEARRKIHRVGYMNEGNLTSTFIETIKRITEANGLPLEFFRLEGVEAEIISGMQTCAVFLAMNVGKSPLWGEGGPMTPHEAMACGTVPVCFDMNGPWELIQQGYNGIVVPRIQPERMAEELLRIYAEPGCLEFLSKNALAVFQTSHTMESRWPSVCEFLQLPEEA
ncbi:MAG TPA: glycosyltransferase family 4 protein [Terrimicrobiaceae bacterium]|nr:glycosyltransferase family 4 protein [Terrimicrobiaceae bacterium]